MKKNIFPRHFSKYIPAILIGISVITRLFLFPISNADMVEYNLRWYTTMEQNGIWRTLGTNFTNYSAMYSYCLAAAVALKTWIPPLTALKLIPFIFDILAAFTVYKIVKIKRATGQTPLWAAAVYFAAPTILINSSLWGQVDATYTAFLLLCVYFFMADKPIHAMIAFGLAFSFKAQAVFLAPFLLIMLFQKRLVWKHLVIPPLVYILSILPVVLAGRGFWDALTVYTAQADTYKVLSAYAPNIYIYFPKESYSLITPAGLAAAAIITIHWIYKTNKVKSKITPEQIFFLACVSVALLPFLMPKMHDRYFYPADALSLVTAFLIPELWFLPLLYQGASSLAISGFLFGAGYVVLTPAFVLTSIASATLLKTQIEKQWISLSVNKSAYIHITAALLPVLISGLFFYLSINPIFLRANFKITKTDASQGNPAASNLLASYLTSNKSVEVLYKAGDTEAIIKKNQASYFEDLKQKFISFFNTWIYSLLALHLLTLLAWAQSAIPDIKRGLTIGGWICAGLTVAASILLPILKPQPAELLYRFMPQQILINAVIFVLLATFVSGILFAFHGKYRQQNEQY